MKVVNVHEAKTTLSALLAQVEARLVEILEVGGQVGRGPLAAQRRGVGAERVEHRAGALRGRGRVALETGPLVVRRGHLAPRIVVAVASGRTRATSAPVAGSTAAKM